MAGERVMGASGAAGVLPGLLRARRPRLNPDPAPIAHPLRTAGAGRRACARGPPSDTLRFQPDPGGPVAPRAPRAHHTHRLQPLHP
ncbi:MAG: hypothetical protein ACK55I_02800, partial [bacterium]